MLSNDLLDLSAYSLIKSCDGYIEKYRFYKLMYLFNKELKSSDLDIRLPFYWYRYGVVVDNANYFFALDKSSINFNRISTDMQEKIFTALKKVMSKYKFKKTDEINAEIYQEAPFKFQDEFRILLDAVKPWKTQNTLDSYIQTDSYNITILLKKLIKAFPEEEFIEIYPLFLEWENYTNQLIENNYSKKEIASFIDDFWFVFVKKLRILKNKNIDEYKINKWKKDYKKSLEKLKNDLFEFSIYYYNNFNETTENEEIVKDLHKYASEIIWE